FGQRKLFIVRTAFAADDNKWMWCVQSQQSPNVGDSPDARRALMPVPVDVTANPVVEGGDGADRNSQLNAGIECGDPIGCVAATRLAGETDAYGIDIRSRGEHVQSAYGIEN